MMMCNVWKSDMFQVGTTGHKNRLIVDMNTASDFHEQLTNFIEHYASLGTIYCTL